MNAFALPCSQRALPTGQQIRAGAVYHEGSAQRDSHDTYDLNDTRNQREQRDTVTDYSECLLMGTTLASPLNLFNGFPNRY